MAKSNKGSLLYLRKPADCDFCHQNHPYIATHKGLICAFCMVPELNAVIQSCSICCKLPGTLDMLWLCYVHAGDYID